MGVVMIMCPNTGRAISTGIETDPASFASPKFAPYPIFAFGHRDALTARWSAPTRALARSSLP